jgi:GxxExxY protein
MEIDELSNRVIGCAIEFHRFLGPGFAYELCLAYELNSNGIAFLLQHPRPVQYKDIRLDCGFRIDMLVENQLIVELNSVEAIKPIHEAQLLKYMKLANVKIGLLINFNSPDRCPLSAENGKSPVELRDFLFGKRPYVFRVIYSIRTDVVLIIRIRRGQMVHDLPRIGRPLLNRFGPKDQGRPDRDDSWRRNLQFSA